MLSRRDFLSRSTLIALTPTVPAFLARTAQAAAPERDGRVLVVIQLDGGNDGINTVVPYADPGYAKHRRELRLPTDRLLKVGDGVGLHPSLGDAAKLLEARRLTIVQGVGYPNPSRSHAQSMATWHTARLDPEEHDGHGWLGRALDSDPRPAAGARAAVLVGANAIPGALRGRRTLASALDRLDDYDVKGAAAAARAMAGPAAAADLAAFVRRSTLDAYATADRLAAAARAPAGSAAYPATALAGRLQLIAHLLKSDFAARIYYAVQPGYDTHAAQLPRHAELLSEFAGALRAFLDDLAAARLADRVAVLAFSEFGRQLRENASGGTDHGTAGPVFLAGTGVRAGLAGAAPSLTALDAGEPRVMVDFRRVYAGVLRDWLGLSPDEPLGGRFDPLPLFG